MGKDLEKLKVTIEGDVSPLKKELNSGRREVSRTLDSIRSSIKKIKSLTSNFSLKGKIKDIQIKAGFKIPTEEYKEISANVQKAEDTLNRYYERRDKLEELGTDQESRAWRSLEYDIRNAEASLKRYENEKKKMESAGGDVKRPVSLPKQALNLASGSVSGLGSIAKKGWGGLTKLLSGVGKTASTATGIIRKCSGAYAALLQKFTSGIPIVRRFTGGIKENGKSFGGGLKNILKYTLGIRSLFVLTNKLRSALVDGFNNLAQYSSTTNASLSMLMSSLTQLKNSLATAFAPILDVIAPILNSFIQMVINVVNSIGQLMGALTGKTTMVTAKKVNQDYAASLDKTSSGLKNNAGNAEKASKAADKYKRTLLGFDQITKMDDNSDSDTSNSSGTNTGSLGGVDNMFQTTAIKSQFKDLAKLIKDSWKNADFTEVGAIVGRKLNSALQNIPWDNIRNTSDRIAKSIATFLNGFIETADWGLVGNTLSQGINTAFGFANTFAQNFHWNSLGDAVGNGINGALGGLDWNLIQDTVHNVVSGLIGTLNNFLATADWNLVGQTIGQYFNTKLEAFYTAVTEFDWKGLGKAISDSLNGAIEIYDFAKAGQAIGNVIKGLLDTFITAVENTDWKQVGEKIGDFLANIDWNGIADRIFEAIGAALGGLAAFIEGLFGDAVDSAKDYIKEHFTEAGKYTWKGFTNGIKDAVSDVGAWIKEHIFNPFLNGFKKAFGIHSPSTVMKEQGGHVMSGLFKGLKDSLPDILGWVGKLPGKVKDKLGNAKDWLKEKGSDAIQGFAAGLQSIHIPLPHISVSWNSHKVGAVSFSTPSFGLNWYAKGGFPAAGEMFVARENGPEMVGRMGNRNAVANNNQIIEGIRAGVFEAVVNALEKFSGNGKQNIEVHVHLEGDSKKLFKIIRQEGNNYQRSTGKPVFD